MITKPDKTGRPPERLRFHYEVERELADRFRRATRQERRQMYGKLYDELYSRVTDHPLLARKALSVGKTLGAGLKSQMGLLRRFLRPETVFMEVGAGSCRLSMAASRFAGKVIAFDVSKEMANRPDLPKNVEVRIFDGVEIQIEPGSVNVAYSHQVMEHVHPEDAQEQVRSILRALAPGGVYLCVVPNRLSGPHDISRHYDEVATAFHMREYTTGELTEVFLRSGYKKTVSFVGARRWFTRVPGWSLQFLENTLDALPFRLRANVCRRFPIKTLLEIRMAAYK